jgi:hypothetical protein
LQLGSKWMLPKEEDQMLGNEAPYQKNRTESEG